MKRIIFVFLFLLSITLYCQVNIEKFRQDQDSVGITANIAAGFSVKTGNSEYQIIDGEGRLNYNGGSYYSFLIFKGDFGWSNGSQFSNESLLHLRFVPALSEVLQLEVFGQIDYDKSRLLLFRDLVGSGLRVKAFKTEGYKLRIGSGLMFEQEKYDLPETAKHKIHSTVFRWTNYLSNEFELQDNLRLLSMVYYQPQINKFSDVRILSENNLIIDVSKYFSCYIRYNLRYDSNPPDGKVQTDSKSRFGISLKI
jgi:putative salt-induced outer membrane protein YdiY